MRTLDWIKPGTAFAALLLLSSCGQVAEDEGDAEEVDIKADNGSPKGDTWGAITELRDDSAMFPTDKPSGGWWVTPIHATLLTSGKVLITGWGRRDKLMCAHHGTRRNGTSFIIDPTQVNGGTIMVSPLDEQGENEDVLYCSGQTSMPDGRILYTGGAKYNHLGDPNQEEFGLDYARIYDPSSGTFSRVHDRLDGGPSTNPGLHWYPTNTRLANGKILVSAGFTGCCDGRFVNLSIHTFDPSRFNAGQNPWTLLVSHADGFGDISPGLKDYTHTFALPDSVNAGGRDRDVLMMGWPGHVVLFSSADGVAAGDRFVEPTHSARPGSSAAAWDATAALVSTGEILVAGGTGDATVAKRVDFYDPKKDSWSSVDTGIGRHNAASVLLPDGRVLIANGENDPSGFPGDRRKPQIIDPVGKTVSTKKAWPNDPSERGYHSFGLLLKDGRVLIGGGTYSKGGIGCERPDMRIYNPSYFSGGKRPRINNVSEPVDMTLGGGSVDIDFQDGPLKGVALMAMGSFTHAFDQNQRYVPLAFTETFNHVKLTTPASAKIAPPGDYLLFLIGKTGVPSVAKHVHLH